MHGVVVGSKYGKWTVILANVPRKGGGRSRAVWQCRCECGLEREVLQDSLVSGKSLGCHSCRKTLRKEVKDLTGDVFGEYTVLSYLGRLRWDKNFWLCQCSCGKLADVAQGDLKNGSRSQCVSCARTTHGASRHVLYSTWCGMKDRCNNPNNPDYKNYGGRGITVCDRWLNSFHNFLDDMGVRPSGRTLDRIDNEGNYEPSNCRWATHKEQANNKRMRRDNTSGVVGVSFSKVTGKWVAQNIFRG